MVKSVPNDPNKESNNDERQQPNNRKFAPARCNPNEATIANQKVEAADKKENRQTKSQRKCPWPCKIGEEVAKKARGRSKKGSGRRQKR